MVLKKPSEIFKNNNNDSSKESDKKIHQEESKVNKRKSNVYLLGVLLHYTQSNASDRERAVTYWDVLVR